MTINYISGNKIQGLSTDTKPINPQDNSTFYETDTKEIYHYVNSAWVKIGEEGAMTSHIIPDTNDTYDLGSAEFKVRDAYISDNSLWVGDDHKVEIAGGKMKFKKRKKTNVPASITNAGGSEAAAKSFRGRSNLTDMTLNDWVKYARTLGGSLANARPNDIFKSDDADDWETDDASVPQQGTAGKILGYNASTGELEEQDAPAGGASANTIVLSNDADISNYTTPTSIDSSSEGIGDPETTTCSGGISMSSSGSYGGFPQSNINGGTPVNASNVTINVTAIRGGSYWAFYAIKKVTTSGGVENVAYDVSMGSRYWSGTLNHTYNLGAVSDFIGVQIGGRAIRSGNSASYVCSATYSAQKLEGYLTDGSTTTFWLSENEVNPWLWADMGSSTRTAQVALNPNNAKISATELEVQTSEDNSTWTTQRTILTSKLTTDAWNFIRFNPITTRYIRIRANDASAKQISFNEIKVKNQITDIEVTNTHGHIDISPTDTSLGLDGT